MNGVTGALFLNTIACMRREYYNFEIADMRISKRSTYFYEIRHLYSFNLILLFLNSDLMTPSDPQVFSRSTVQIWTEYSWNLDILTRKAPEASFSLSKVHHVGATFSVNADKLFCSQKYAYDCSD